MADRGDESHPDCELKGCSTRGPGSAVEEKQVEASDCPAFVHISNNWMNPKQELPGDQFSFGRRGCAVGKSHAIPLCQAGDDRSTATLQLAAWPAIGLPLVETADDRLRVEARYGET